MGYSKFATKKDLQDAAERGHWYDRYQMKGASSRRVRKFMKVSRQVAELAKFAKNKTKQKPE